MRGVSIVVTSSESKKESMRYRTLLIITVLLVSSAAAVARPRKHTREPHDQQVERTTAAAPDVVLSI